MQNGNRQLDLWQRRYLIWTAAVAPFAPLLYLQGRITRWKVGVLPEAAGERSGRQGGEGDSATLLVLGESTVAGLGARNHDLALAGQFARCLGDHLDRPIEWTVVGKNGVTARRTIAELLPQIPSKRFDYILVGLGGNDVMGLSSPRRWRSDMAELISILREKNPEAVIFLSNCPMIIMSPVIPEPIKTVLWQLSQMHDANAREFTAEMDRVFYYPQPADVTLDGFFADGIHPSEKGYADWAGAMMRHFASEHRW